MDVDGFIVVDIGGEGPQCRCATCRVLAWHYPCTRPRRSRVSIAPRVEKSRRFMAFESFQQAKTERERLETGCFMP